MINRSRFIKEKAMKALTSLAAITTSALLILILGTIFVKAIPSLSLSFLLTPEVEAETIGGGIAHAIMGTILLSITSVTIATPFGVGTAIYLKRYARNQKLVGVIRYLIDVLSGTPSIVLGLFGLLLLVYYLRPFTGGFSLISGGIALAVLIIPLIERSTEEAISTVPQSYEEGSFALGATRWDTIKCITLPCAMSGIVTGVVLAVGRAAEESAVVVLTAGFTQFLPEFGVHQNSRLVFGTQILPFQDLVATLPLAVYHAYENGNLMPLSHGFASALVLIFIVMIINAIARVILWSYKARPFQGKMFSSLFKNVGQKPKKSRRQLSVEKTTSKVTMHPAESTQPSSPELAIDDLASHVTPPYSHLIKYHDTSANQTVEEDSSTYDHEQKERIG